MKVYVLLETTDYTENDRLIGVFKDQLKAEEHLFERMKRTARLETEHVYPVDYKGHKMWCYIFLHSLMEYGSMVFSIEEVEVIE